MQFFLKNKSLIIKLFQLIEVGIFLLWVGGFIFAMQDPELAMQLYPIGLEVGKYAMIFYCLTLVPGILKRFNVLTPVRVVLMTFRRHLGIMTFMLVWLHMSWGSILPLTSFYGYSIKAVSLFSVTQWFGLSAFLLLIPMFLTSNDYSVKKLGPYWNRIHKLTYIILFLSFMHVALIESKWLLLIVPTMIAWVFSWMTYFSTQMAKKQLPVTDDTIKL